MGLAEITDCPVCGRGLGRWDEVYTPRGGDHAVGCSRCLGLGQVEAGERLACGYSGEDLGGGAWYVRRRGTGQPLGSEGFFRKWAPSEYWGGCGWHT